ncbi:MAG: hypothetical protein ACOYM2_18240 [Rectinemataceae bacterium]
MLPLPSLIRCRAERIECRSRIDAVSVLARLVDTGQGLFMRVVRTGKPGMILAALARHGDVVFADLGRFAVLIALVPLPLLIFPERMV